LSACPLGRSSAGEAVGPQATFRSRTEPAEAARPIFPPLDQVEIYFSILQRKVQTPNDFADLDVLRIRLEFYEELTNRRPKPFAWKFIRQEVAESLGRAAPHLPAAKAA
jgi:hypothetical protein